MMNIDRVREEKIRGALVKHRRVWRPIDGISDIELTDLCRNERCRRKDMHAFHLDVEDSTKEQKKRGWISDPFEKERWTKINIDISTNKQPSKFSLKENICEIPRPPSHRACPRGVDNAIALAVSSIRMKVISEIHQDVLDTFGAVDARTVYRRLAKLVQRGCVIRVSFDHNNVIPLFSSKPPIGAENGIVLPKVRGCDHAATNQDKCVAKLRGCDHAVSDLTKCRECGKPSWKECGKSMWKDDPPRGTLSGYLRPTSRLFTDPASMKDQLWEACCGMGAIFEDSELEAA